MELRELDNVQDLKLLEASRSEGWTTLHEMYPELKHRRASAAERDELGASLSVRTTSLLQT